MVSHAPFMLSSTIWSKSSGSVSHDEAPSGPVPPATLTSTSILP